MPSLEREAHGEVRRTGTLSDPTLVAHDEHFVFDPLHPFGHQPATVPLLVLLTGFVLIADRAGPHVDTGIAAAGVGRLNDVQFTSHVSSFSKALRPIWRFSSSSSICRHADIIALRGLR